jgi:peptidoglycan/LPS O-acetylase OafA/YrhL
VGIIVETNTASDGKITAIQLLRALAALTVTAVHLAIALADHVPPGLGLPPGWTGEREGQGAVMLFFIVSGYVMVIAARGAFGRAGARAVFWRRRAVRILPPYWIATAQLAGVLVTFYRQAPDPARLFQSLLLIPYWPGDGTLRPLPFLWVGWTLFYELAFYALFGLFLGWRRGAALAGIVAVLVAVTIAGLAVPPVYAPLFAVTRPVILVFAVGLLLGQWRESGGTAPRWLRLASLAAMVAALALIGRPPDIAVMGFDVLLWSALPAALLAFAVLGGPLALPGERLIIAAGDMSYALYLLHVPTGLFWLWFWQRLPGFTPGPWDTLASALVATLATSWLFHRHIERPLTLTLNRWLAAPHIVKSIRRKTP